MIDITVHFSWPRFRADSDAARAIDGLIDALDDKWGLYDTFGTGLRDSAVERISVTNLSPDGNPWKKSRRVEKEGGKTLNKSGWLRMSIHHQAEEDGVRVGSTGNDKHYSAVHQLGAAVGALGFWAGTDKNGRQMSVLSPWGDSPARPYLSISDEDEANIYDAVTTHLTLGADGKA